MAAGLRHRRRATASRRRAHCVDVRPAQRALGRSGDRALARDYDRLSLSPTSRIANQPARKRNSGWRTLRRASAGALLAGEPLLLTMKRMGLFGGSFDPVHNGHLLVAMAACEEIGLERVFFI